MSLTEEDLHKLTEQTERQATENWSLHVGLLTPMTDKASYFQTDIVYRRGWQPLDSPP